MKKFTIFAFCAMLVSSAFSCWYNSIGFQNYIYSINNISLHTLSVGKGSQSGTITNKTQYIVKNNMVVDFPISVAVKLVSDQPVRISGITSANQPQVTKAILQYRILPNGNWQDVKTYEANVGTIPATHPPAFYFGRNNISPNCNAGALIMIRVYVQAGFYESGDIADLCDAKLEDSINDIPTLKTDMTFYVDSNNSANVDLGGGWSPALVTTVRWSGKYRAAK